MPTYAELEREPAWGAEYEPPNLATLTAGLRAHYGVSRSHIGCKGDNNHVRGYHRSRRWILQSRYSRFGADDYSIQYPADMAGDDDWLAGMDFQTRGGVPELVEVCRRLDTQVRAERCPQIREWYGNIDGDRIVDGWENVRNRAATSDSSHLWHLHISFLRGRANDDHSDLFAILTGTSGGTTMLGLSKGATGIAVEALQEMLLHSGFDPGATDGRYGDATAAALLALRRSIGSTADNGDTVTAIAYEQILRVHASRQTTGGGERGPAGPAGPAGPVGPAGPRGERGQGVGVGDTLIVTAQA